MGTKNMTEADRKRIREEAAAKRKARENKQFWILMGITAVVALVLILIPVIKRNMAYPDRIRDMDDVQASWVVRDLNPRTNLNKNTSNVDDAPNVNKPRYYHLATMKTPEGYTQEKDFSLGDSEKDRDLHFTAKEPGGTLEAVYLVGIPNKDAKKHATDATQRMSVNGRQSEIVEAKIAGADVLYTLFTYPQSATESYASLCIYLDTPHDACLMMVLNSYVLPTEELPALEALLAEAEALLPLVTIEK